MAWRTNELWKMLEACIRTLPTLAVGGYRSITHRGTVSTDMSASFYKSSPTGRKTGFQLMRNRQCTHREPVSNEMSASRQCSDLNGLQGSIYDSGIVMTSLVREVA
jgi:hypothetical protein